jgi:glycosyltransferase involved in cell wall biosynthesis
MRVLFVSQEFPPETGWGGIGTYIDVISHSLAEKGVDVHVLSIVDKQAVSTREVGGVTVHRLPLPPVYRPARYAPESWRRIWLAWTVARMVPQLALQASVVECPEWMAEGLGVALRGSVPLVVRLHSSARQLFPFTRQGKQCFGADGRLAARLEEISARKANVVVSTPSNLAEVAGRLRLDERALCAISYPVRLPPPIPMLDDGAPRVSFLGRFEARKAPEIVLRAAPKVIAAVPDARFAFVGRDVNEPGAPSSAQWLRREAERLGVAHAVEVQERFGRDVVLDELRRATVCAVPSRWESFGYAVAEASAVGRPVVVSPIPPFRDLVKDGVTGRIAPLEDSDAWAGALIDLLQDRERARSMGQAGAAHVTRISDPDRVTDEVRAAHELACARWRRGERAGRR